MMVKMAQQISSKESYCKCEIKTLSFTFNLSLILLNKIPANPRGTPARLYCISQVLYSIIPIFHDFVNQVAPNDFISLFSVLISAFKKYKCNEMSLTISST